MQRKIRQSQTLTPFGVGAIFDFRGESFVAMDTYRWAARGTPVQSARLAKALGVKGFRAAPAVEQSAWAPAATVGIPYARFPVWLFCQQCRGMTRWRRAMEQEGKVPLCPTCPGKKQLVPMRWVQICANGHMDDVDWNRWAHSRRDADAAQGRCEKEKLVFRTFSGAGAGGLDTLYVQCVVCSQRRDLRGISSQDGLKSVGLKCTGGQPWQRWEDRVDCSEAPRAVQRGASNVWYSKVESSIEVPSPTMADTDSDQALQVKNDPFFPGLLTVNEDSPMFSFACQQIAQGHSVTEEFVRALVQDEQAQVSGQASSVTAAAGDLLAEEWAAFITVQIQEHRDFRTRHVGFGDVVDDSLEAAVADRVERVVVADRLREVRALQGFNRVSPDRPVVPVDLGKGLTWLPAVEVLGEGLFLSLEEGRLVTWEEHDAVAARTAEMDRRIDRSFMASRFRAKTGPRLTPRYLLLHTLAHVLIRRLAFESGYSAASLRERIYARDPGGDDGVPMAGLLIYTAAGDSEGTLGGLVRQGEPPRFARTLLEALADARWCSADPLCSESKSTSLSGLNFSACHACSLVAETSCETGNFLLDRAVLVGHDDVPGFFEEVVLEGLTTAGEAILEPAT